MFTTIQLAKGVQLHVHPTTQFKTVNFSIKWRAPLTDEAAAARTVLTNVLQHSNAKYDTTAAFRSYLDDLYGTVLYFDTAKRGNEHTVLLNVETVNDQYLKNANVLQEVLQTIHTSVFEPNVDEAGQFKEAIVNREREMVVQRIQSIFDDKTRYAQQQLTKLMRPNHAASISANGSLEAVKALTVADVTAAYHDMLLHDRIDIYVVGDVQPDEMATRLKQELPFADRDAQPLEAIPASTTEFEYVREQQDMKQGKLHIGYSTSVRFGDDDFAAMQIFNGMFGGYPHAKLFMNVREKESLAYYASSSYSGHYGLVFVLAGIEAANEEKAYTLIQQQLTAMQQGDMTELELAQTKAMLTNQLKEALDSARGQIEVYDQYKELDEQFSIDTWAARWDRITLDDVARMAKYVTLEKVYFLSGKEQE
ncbi:EF-P 5-aminopentanol modification-associated protein YfmF [Caryophanon latum]|uniref:Peptidase M16 n=1 Tax=Caryophanon latum TaxID=33977 RepID=A0A1C0YYX0_9BACL|nr:pitrilysin family protein [Caryophanon latum]OCS92379.1 peptidase M16 [Caryophanon latum]